MKFLKFWNRFFFLRRFNVFDILSIMIINALIVSQSWWCSLLVIPAFIISAIMELKVELDSKPSKVES